MGNNQYALQMAAAHLKEGHGGAIFHHAILNLGLLGQVVGGVDGRLHALHGEEGCEVSGVGRNDDESEKPPDAPYYPGGEGFGHQL